MTIIKVKRDTEFAAFARQLQNNWRIKHGYPIGAYKNDKGEKIELGSYIKDDFAYQTGKNFLTENIHNIVIKSLNNREKGAKIEKTRLYTNLLSSQPLAFNLFGELAVNKRLATQFFTELFPERISEVYEILFEHSSGRGIMNIRVIIQHLIYSSITKQKMAQKDLSELRLNMQKT
jgi:hypothetical protein